MSNAIQTISTPVVSLVAIIGLIVLVALGKITWAEGGPPILLLAGVHLGANVANSTPTPAPAVTTPPAKSQFS